MPSPLNTPNSEHETSKSLFDSLENLHSQLKPIQQEQQQQQHQEQLNVQSNENVSVVQTSITITASTPVTDEFINKKLLPDMKTSPTSSHNNNNNNNSNVNVDKTKPIMALASSASPLSQATSTTSTVVTSDSDPDSDPSTWRNSSIKYRRARLNLNLVPLKNLSLPLPLMPAYHQNGNYSISSNNSPINIGQTSASHRAIPHRPCHSCQAAAAAAATSSSTTSGHKIASGTNFKPGPGAASFTNLSLNNNVNCISSSAVGQAGSTTACTCTCNNSSSSSNSSCSSLSLPLCANGVSNSTESSGFKIIDVNNKQQQQHGMSFYDSFRFMPLIPNNKDSHLLFNYQDAQRINPHLDLELQEWFHGYITRQDAEQILQDTNNKIGSYLVRKHKSHYTLSLKSIFGYIHFRLFHCVHTDKWSLGWSSCGSSSCSCPDKSPNNNNNNSNHNSRSVSISPSVPNGFIPTFDSIPRLINYFTFNPLPLNGCEHMALLYPIATRLL